MHCGLTNAPAPLHLPMFMNGVFRDILDVCVVVYLEDILIYFDNPGEHLKHVREVLQPIHASTLYAKVEKCAFSVDTTDYPGFVISPDGLRMDTPKIQVILDCPEKVRMSNRSWFRKHLQTVYRLVPRYRLVLRYHHPTDSAHAQGHLVRLVSAV